MERGPTAYRFGDVRVDLRNFQVFKAGRAVHLEPKVVRALVYLIEQRGRLIEKKELLDAVWRDTFVTENAMTKVIAKLRKTLGDVITDAKYVETVPTRGYRFIARVEEERDPTREGTFDSVAVLPFVNASDDPEVEYLSDGITESLINSLTRLRPLRVIARTTVFRYKGQPIEAQDIGTRLGVRSVVTGRVLQRGDRLTIGVELVDVADGSQLWGERYTRPLSDIFAAQEEIARDISVKLQPLTGEQRKLLTRRDTADPEAYKLYLKGTYCNSKWTEDGWKTSIELFTGAIHRDPAYALAYAGLANVYVKLGLFGVIPQKEAYPKAKAAAFQALNIDDSLAEVHTSLGFVTQLYDWDWSRARRAFQRAIEIDPNCAQAYHIYAYHFVHLGQFDEAIAAIRHAEELDPLSVEYLAAAADILKDARRYGEAVEVCGQALKMDANYGEAHLFLGQAYEYQGMYEQAIESYYRAAALTGNSPETAASLGHACAAAGRRDAARTVIADLMELSNRRYVDPSLIAVVHAALGEHDLAFEWLDKAYQDRSGMLVHAKVEPIFDELRRDPRFTTLLQRVGLPL